MCVLKGSSTENRQIWRKPNDEFGDMPGSKGHTDSRTKPSGHGPESGVPRKHRDQARISKLTGDSSHAPAAISDHGFDVLLWRKMGCVGSELTA